MARWRVSLHQSTYRSQVICLQEHTWRALCVFTGKEIAHSHVVVLKMLIRSCWEDDESIWVCNIAIHFPSGEKEQQRFKLYTPGSSFLPMKCRFGIPYTTLDDRDHTHVKRLYSEDVKINWLFGTHSADVIEFFSSCMVTFQDKSSIEKTFHVNPSSVPTSIDLLRRTIP